MAGKAGVLTIRGGKFLGKKLKVPPGSSVRPTTDRARERAFQLIEQRFRHPDGRARWAGARVLDAFAGTGALGIEAASRGARHITFWDISTKQAKALEDLIRTIDGFDSVVSCQNALAPPPGLPADLIFLDPPYNLGLLDRAVKILAKSGWIGPSTLIYGETEAGCNRPKSCRVIVQKPEANSILWLLRWTGDIDQTRL